MGFLAPAFLGGLVALGLPVWLHLLRQHRSTPLPFSSLMFFERRTQSSIKHRRLRYLLLLAARLALLLFLVLAFANPFVRRVNPPVGGGHKFVVIAVDNSFSMRTGDRLARAKREASGALGSRNAGDAAQVMALGSQVHLLTQPTEETPELRSAIESIQPSDSRSSFGELARALRSMRDSSRVPIEAHLFSDMQKTSLPPGFIDLRLSEGTTLVLHPMADKREPNFAVENVVAPRAVYDPKKVRLQVTVAGYGTPAPAQRTVSLVVANKTVATKTVSVPAGGRATAEFLSLDAPYGFSRAEARIDAADSLPDDDHFSFAVERTDPRHVLFVHEARQPRGLLYFRTAMDSSSDAAFLLDAVTTDQVANVAPGKYAFVVLSDVASLPPSFEEALNKYVRGGGAVLIAAGPSTVARPKLPVFDERVVESRYASRTGERFLTAGYMDSTHPAIRSANKWENVKFYQSIRVEPGQARVVVKLSDDTPLLMEKQVGEGHAMVFASTFDNISNDFPLRPAFVPFVEQISHYLAGSETRPSNYAVDSHVDLRSVKDQSTAVEVLDPAGKRALSLKEAVSAQSFALTETGFYDVRRANGRHELVAVNSDRKESDLDLAPQETLNSWRGTGGGPGGPGGEEAAARPQNWSLWWYAMLIVLALSLAESFLASRYLGVEKETA